MSAFNYNKKETYNQSEVDEIINQHYRFAEKELKTEFDKKEKDYQNKLNEYTEKELFTGLDDKQTIVARSLLNNDQYKSLPKNEALNKIKSDFPETFNAQPVKDNLQPGDLNKLVDILKEIGATEKTPPKTNKNLTDDELKGMADKAALTIKF